MKTQPARPLPWGLLTGKLKKECNFQCEGCGEHEDLDNGRPLRLAFKDGKISNRARSNLLMLCPKCTLKALNAQRRRRNVIHAIHQMDLNL